MKLKALTKKGALALLPLMLTVGVAGGLIAGRYMAVSPMSDKETKLHTILGMINEQYVDKIDVDSLLETIFPDLLSSLDPHSAYIPASDLTAVNNELEGSFSGVGIVFQIVGDTVQVIEVVPDGPAEKVGMLPGDRILSADTVMLVGPDVSNDKVFSTLRGKKNTKVNLKIKRSNSPTPFELEVKRGDIPVKSVDSHYMLSENTGYIRVNKFARNTYSEFINALDDLSADGADNFVIDLRNNQGGFMDQAIYMANEFLPPARMIVYTRGRNAENETVAISDGRGSYQNAQLTVLTNEFSASASEIFSGAMQDNDRGLVIGRRTFGKGLVQNQTELPDSSALRLTVARYYTPSGRSIQKDYVLGRNGKYEMEIVDRYNNGEIYSADSIRKDPSKVFKTVNGRTVYGGGGITPDIFVAEDTTGYTSYYAQVMNKGLIQKYAYEVADKYRPLLSQSRSLKKLLKSVPRDNTLLDNFVSFAARNGVPARWYYINQSRGLILNNLKAFIARDILGYEAFIEVLNEEDVVIKEALRAIDEGKSPVNIENKEAESVEHSDLLSQKEGSRLRHKEAGDCYTFRNMA